MTIKQLGGVFGRNPTFNDVTIEGTLTFDGALDITSDLTIGGNLTVSKTYGPVIKLESAGTGLGSGTVIGDIQFFGNDLSVPGAGIKAGIKVETVAALGDDAQMKFTTSDGATNNIDRMLIANNGDISFYEDTGTTAKLFWDASAESLGIGTTSPSTPIHVNSGTGNIAATFESTDAGSYINIIDNGSGAFGAMIGAVSDDIVFSPNNVEAMRIDSSGHVIAPYGVTLGTAAGTYNAANTLDDYEEGTWTPVLSDAQTGGNTATGSSILGIYTKVGNVVHVTIRAINIDTGGMTAGNDLFIQGLPFTQNGTFNFMGAITAADITFSGFLTLYGSGGTTVAKVSETVSATGIDFITIGDLTSGNADIQADFRYRIS